MSKFSRPFPKVHYNVLKASRPNVETRNGLDILLSVQLTMEARGRLHRFLNHSKLEVEDLITVEALRFDGETLAVYDAARGKMVKIAPLQSRVLRTGRERLYPIDIIIPRMLPLSCHHGDAPICISVKIGRVETVVSNAFHVVMAKSWRVLKIKGEGGLKRRRFCQIEFPEVENGDNQNDLSVSGSESGLEKESDDDDDGLGEHGEHGETTERLMSTTVGVCSPPPLLTNDSLGDWILDTNIDVPFILDIGTP